MAIGTGILMEPRPSKFLNICINHAIENPGVNRAKIAALIAVNNKIISIGRNSRRTHPLAKQYQKIEGAECLHAEIDAIAKALKKVDNNTLSKATMYIARVKHPNKDDDSWVNGLAKPCKGCAQAINQFKFKNVIWTNNEH